MGIWWCYPLKYVFLLLTLSIFYAVAEITWVSRRHQGLTSNVFLIHIKMSFRVMNFVKVSNRFSDSFAEFPHVLIASVYSGFTWRFQLDGIEDWRATGRFWWVLSIVSAAVVRAVAPSNEASGVILVLVRPWLSWWRESAATLGLHESPRNWLVRSAGQRLGFVEQFLGVSVECWNSAGPLDPDLIPPLGSGIRAQYCFAYGSERN